MWRQAIACAAIELRAEHAHGYDVRIEDVFRRAQVPDAGYVHAERLGLRRVAKTILNDQLYPDHYEALNRWRQPWPMRPVDGRGRR